MEANDFVFDDSIGVAHGMNSGSILDPTCGNCTPLVDLKPGEW
jgi:hypothetical protein